LAAGRRDGARSDRKLVTASRPELSQHQEVGTVSVHDKNLLTPASVYKLDAIRLPSGDQAGKPLFSLSSVCVLSSSRAAVPPKRKLLAI
jgi:hypothetical protein